MIDNARRSTARPADAARGPRRGARRWWMAIAGGWSSWLSGVYVLVIKAGCGALARPPAPKGRSPSRPAHGRRWATPAQARDMGVYLTGLGGSRAR